jgi:hypothetical protein
MTNLRNFPKASWPFTVGKGFYAELPAGHTPIRILVTGGANGWEIELIEISGASFNTVWVSSNNDGLDDLEVSKRVAETAGRSYSEDYHTDIEWIQASTFPIKPALSATDIS